MSISHSLQLSFLLLFAMSTTTSHTLLLPPNTSHYHITHSTPPTQHLPLQHHTHYSTHPTLPLSPRCWQHKIVYTSIGVTQFPWQQMSQVLVEVFSEEGCKGSHHLGHHEQHREQRLQGLLALVHPSSLSLQPLSVEPNVPVCELVNELDKTRHHCV